MKAASKREQCKVYFNIVEREQSRPIGQTWNLKQKKGSIWSTKKRTCFAVVAATIVNKKNYCGVFDHLRGQHIAITVSRAESDSPDFFDNNRGAAVIGNVHDMFDYATASHVLISQNGNRIDCFDYETSTRVLFTVNGDSVSALDYQTNNNYNYSVS